MTNNFYYMTPQWRVATEHLRSVELNSITWENFTGDFKSVLKYLNRICDYIWNTWEIDTTDFLTSVVEKQVIACWEPKHRPYDYDYCTHFIIEETGIMSEYGDYECKVTGLNVLALANFENDLHCTIAEQLESKNKQ